MIEVDNEIPGPVGEEMEAEHAELLERLLSTEDVEEQSRWRYWP